MYGAGDTNTKTSFANGWNNVNGHWNVGVTGGEEQHILTINEMPSHNHSIKGRYYASNGTDQEAPQYGVGSGNTGGSDYTYYTNYIGNGAAHNIMPRFMSLAYIMKL